MTLYYYLYYITKKVVSEYFARILVATFQIFFGISIFRVFILEAYGKVKDDYFSQIGLYRLLIFVVGLMAIAVAFIFNYNKRVEKLKGKWENENMGKVVLKLICTLLILTFFSFFLVTFMTSIRHYN
jgi:heme/copper-type cytochrome/quinol oxidase subunit 2